MWRFPKASESSQVTYCCAGCGAFLRKANHPRLLTAVQGVALSQGKQIIPGYLLLCRVWRFSKESESSQVTYCCAVCGAFPRQAASQVTYCCAGCGAFPRQANHSRLLTAVQGVALSQGKRIIPGYLLLCRVWRFPKASGIPGYLLLCRVWRFPKASESFQVTYCCAGCGAFPRQANHSRLLTAVQGVALSQGKRIIPGYLLLCRVWRFSKASESSQVTYCRAGFGAFLRQANHLMLLTAVQGVALSQGKRIIPGYLLLCRVWRFPKASESSQVTYCFAGCGAFSTQVNHPR